MTTQFSGKTILVTGATAGIGRAGALKIARNGGHVVAVGRDPGRLEDLRVELGGNALVVADDAADPGTGAALARAIEHLPGLDGLWLNAGYAEIRPLEAVDAPFFDAMMAANVRGPVLQMAALAPRLKDGASVVVTSSTSTYEGAAVASVYAATKGALVALVRGWATALGPRRIRVNTLVPGPIDTDFRSFMAADLRAEFEANVGSRLALPEMGSAEQAAAVALFLLSDEAAFVTGSQYAVDGGLTMV